MAVRGFCKVINIVNHLQSEYLMLRTVGGSTQGTTKKYESQPSDVTIRRYEP